MGGRLSYCSVDISMTVRLFSELIRLNWLAAPPQHSCPRFFLFACCEDASRGPPLLLDLAAPDSRLSRCFMYLRSQCVSGYSGTLLLFSSSFFPLLSPCRPFAPGLYLLLSLTVMKPAFKERGAGSEASQIRSVKRLAGWAWWMRARMSFCRGCIVKSFHCHRRAYEGLMNEGASVRNTLPPLPLPPL